MNRVLRDLEHNRCPPDTRPSNAVGLPIPFRPGASRCEAATNVVSRCLPGSGQCLNTGSLNNKTTYIVIAEERLPRNRFGH